MKAETRTIEYEDQTVRWFTIASITWGAVAMLAGVLIATQLNFWKANFNLEWLTFGRLLRLNIQRILILFNGRIMTFLQFRHLLLLLMASMNGFSNGSTYRTANIFASMIMAQNIPRTDTMRHLTLLVLAFCNMLPQTFHPSTMWCDWTLPILMRTFGSMTK